MASVRSLRRRSRTSIKQRTEEHISLEAAVASEAKKITPALSLNIYRRSIRSIPCLNINSFLGQPYVRVRVRTSGRCSFKVGGDCEE